MIIIPFKIELCKWALLSDVEIQDNEQKKIPYASSIPDSFANKWKWQGLLTFNIGKKEKQHRSVR